MFSSAKFLSPIVTAGLPTPGPLAAGAGVLAWVLAELELDEDLLLPQAVSARHRAAITAADRMLALRCWCLLRLLSDIASLPMLMYWIWVTTVLGSRRGLFARAA